MLARFDSFVDVGAQSITLREDGDGIAGLEVRRRVRSNWPVDPLTVPQPPALAEAHGEVARALHGPASKGTLNKRTWPRTRSKENRGS